MTGYCIPYFCYSFSHFYVEQLRNDKLSIDEDELQEVRGIMGNIALGQDLPTQLQDTASGGE